MDSQGGWVSNLNRLIEIIAQLRSPEGCPWDRAQTLRSMRGYLLEETYEVLEAIDLPDSDPVRAELLSEELGDLLFNVLLLVQIASDDGQTTLEQVSGRITDKMIRRHPHVFDPEHGDRDSGGLAAWEARKTRQKQRSSRLDGIPRALPALLRAHRQGEKASLVGFDWPSVEGVFDKIDEELGELREALASGEPSQIEAEYGDVLLSASSLGRHIGAEPETSLLQANDRFRARFVRMELLARERAMDLSEADDASLDALWEEAKRALAGR
jgi:tetrapyrrole methylase family protein/MazG family protein